MITCQHARHLFDRYLDGELSPALQAELHAHQLSCTECRSELALLEACGDVIALDQCEPRLSASFTDRVLSARRFQVTGRPGPWGRRVLLVGSPIAAAASIALAILLILPSVRWERETVIAGADDGGVVAVPKQIQDMLQKSSDTEMSASARIELQRTPQMPPVRFVDAVFAPVVKQARDTLAGARRNVGELKRLAESGFADPHEKLVAQWRSAQAGSASPDQTTESTDLDELDLFYPDYPPLEPADETAADRFDPL